MLKTYALGKKASTHDFPFDEETLVLRVKNKIFALIPLNASPQRVNLKCDPAWADILRQTYSAVTPGWHMNKQHWNTVNCETGLSNKLLQELIDHSYNLIVKSLPKKVQAEFENL